MKILGYIIILIMLFGCATRYPDRTSLKPLFTEQISKEKLDLDDTVLIVDGGVCSFTWVY